MFLRTTILVVLVGLASVFFLWRPANTTPKGELILNPYVPQQETAAAEASSEPASRTVSPVWLIAGGAVIVFILIGAAVADRVRASLRHQDERFVYQIPTGRIAPEEPAEAAASDEPVSVGD